MKRLISLIPLVGTIDLGSTLVYWVDRGVPPAEVLRSIASWAAPNASLQWSTYALGAVVDLSIYALVVLVFHGMFRRSHVARRLWGPIGALYGICAYVLIFHVVLPVLIYPAQLANPPTWVAACISLHAFLIGPLIAHGVLEPWGRPQRPRALAQG